MGHILILNIEPLVMYRADTRLDTACTSDIRLCKSCTQSKLRLMQRMRWPYSFISTINRHFVTYTTRQRSRREKNGNNNLLKRPYASKTSSTDAHIIIAWGLGQGFGIEVRAAG
jgi:Na+-translocating ferredoxin:NAD+ oxidoreductase RnfC subunit